MSLKKVRLKGRAPRRRITSLVDSAFEVDHVCESIMWKVIVGYKQ